MSALSTILQQATTNFPEFSDILFTAGNPVQIEVSGKLNPLKGSDIPSVLYPFHLELIGNEILGRNRKLLRDLLSSGACDFSFQLPNQIRFRGNLFRQRENLALVMRKLSSEIPSAEKLNLPPVFVQMAKEKNGLVLVTGSTGSGKSTSLAALIDTINSTEAKHIVTLEDPIEYLHPIKKSLINQRELGSDFNSFANGLKAALRQAPKVILVGEIRDGETLRIALEASETGHLVLGTLHTANCAQTIHRIVSMFDITEERQVRTRLANSLKCVLSQRLLPQENGKRVAAFEILTQTLHVQDLIINGETEQETFYDLQEQGEVYGMRTFDGSLAELFRQGKINEQTALLNASSKGTLRQALDKIKHEQGLASDNTKLEIDDEYGQDN